MNWRKVIPDKVTSRCICRDTANYWGCAIRSKEESGGDERKIYIEVYMLNTVYQTLNYLVDLTY